MPSNWSTGSFPESPGVTVSLGALPGGQGNATVLDLRAVSVGTLLVGPANSLRWRDDTVLTIHSGITNDGTISLADTFVNGAAILRVAGNVTLGGTGTISLLSPDGVGINRIESATAADVLTIGSGQTLLASPVGGGTGRTYQVLLSAELDNGGLVEATANRSKVAMNLLPKTNNGTFRASLEGEIEIRESADLLTNYDHTSSTLTGGRWEILAYEGPTTTMDLQGASISCIAPGTVVKYNGPNATFPALSAFSKLEGTLALAGGKVFSVARDVTLGGNLQISVTGVPDATRLNVTGNIDFNGVVIDLFGYEAKAGDYEVVRWTGTATGAPVIGNAPPGLSTSLVMGANSLTLRVTGTIVGEEVKILDFSVGSDFFGRYPKLTYRSIAGERLGVRAGSNLDNFNLILPNTEVGDGSIMEYTTRTPHANRRFYRLVRLP